MFAEYNFQIIQQNEFQTNHLNRSFMYGDSVFETIILKDGEIRFLDDHLERLYNGLNALSINLPENFTKQSLEESIFELSRLNNIEGNARIKLQVWRKSGGLIIPTEEEGDFLITANELPFPPKPEKENVSFYEAVKLSYTPYSANKTSNMLPYILAGVFMKKNNFDDLILFNNENFVTECVYSNIFWISNNVVYTPSVSCGCIAGVMRKQILALLKTNNIPFEEGKYTREDLLAADASFTSNVSGIVTIKNLENKEMETSNSIISDIKNYLEP